MYVASFPPNFGLRMWNFPYTFIAFFLFDMLTVYQLNILNASFFPKHAGFYECETVLTRNAIFI